MTGIDGVTSRPVRKILLRSRAGVTKRFAAFAAIAIMLMAGPADAQFQLIGSGLTSCGGWTAARRDRQAGGYEQWIVGFLSGIGYQGDIEGANPLNGLDAYAVWAWTDNYCAAHPLETIFEAATAFSRAHPH